MHEQKLGSCTCIFGRPHQHSAMLALTAGLRRWSMHEQKLVDEERRRHGESQKAEQVSVLDKVTSSA